MIKINNTFDVPQHITELTWAQYKRIVLLPNDDFSMVCAAVLGIPVLQFAEMQSKDFNIFILQDALSFIFNGGLKKLKDIPASELVEKFNIAERSIGELAIIMRGLLSLGDDTDGILKKQELVFSKFTGKSQSETEAMPAYKVIWASNFFLKELRKFKESSNASETSARKRPKKFLLTLRRWLGLD